MALGQTRAQHQAIVARRLHDTSFAFHSKAQINVALNQAAMFVQALLQTRVDREEFGIITLIDSSTAASQLYQVLTYPLYDLGLYLDPNNDGTLVEVEYLRRARFYRVLIGKDPNPSKSGYIWTKYWVVTAVGGGLATGFYIQLHPAPPVAVIQGLKFHNVPLNWIDPTDSATPDGLYFGTHPLLDHAIQVRAHYLLAKDYGDDVSDLRTEFAEAMSVVDTLVATGSGKELITLSDRTPLQDYTGSGPSGLANDRTWG